MEGSKTSGVSGNDTSLAGMTSDIVSAYLSNNQIRPDDVPNLISKVHGALQTTVSGTYEGSEGEDSQQPKQQKQPRGEPMISVKKSITPDAIFSLEDGKPYKTLKRHLTGRGMTPEQYKEKWGLPASYPMVAPNYAKARSELATKMGLGRKPGTTVKGAAGKAAKGRKAANGNATGTGRGRKKAAAKAAA